MDKNQEKNTKFAQKAVAGAGLAFAGAGAALGAEALLNPDEPVETKEEKEPEATDSHDHDTKTGGSEHTVHTDHTPHTPQPEVVNINIRIVETGETKESEGEEGKQSLDPEVVYEKRTEFYDEWGGYLGSEDSGTIDGKHFSVVDNDRDNMADEIWIDHNKDGIIQEEEVQNVKDANMVMGNNGNIPIQEAIIIETGTDPDYPYNPDDPEGLVSFHKDYNNHADVSRFTASVNMPNGENKEEILSGEEHLDGNNVESLPHNGPETIDPEGIYAHEGEIAGTVDPEIPSEEIEITPADEYEVAATDPSDSYEMAEPSHTEPVPETLDTPLADNSFESLDTSVPDDFSHDDIDVAMV